MQSASLHLCLPLLHAHAAATAAAHAATACSAALPCPAPHHLDVPCVPAQAADVLVTGTLGLAYPDTAKALRAAALAAKAAGAVVLVDVNWRPVFWPQGLEHAKKVILEYLQVRVGRGPWVNNSGPAFHACHALPAFVRAVLRWPRPFGCGDVICLASLRHQAGAWHRTALFCRRVPT